MLATLCSRAAALAGSKTTALEFRQSCAIIILTRSLVVINGLLKYHANVCKGSFQIEKNVKFTTVS